MLLRIQSFKAHFVSRAPCKFCKKKYNAKYGPSLNLHSIIEPFLTTECEASGEYRLGALLKRSTEASGFTAVSCDYEWDLSVFEDKTEWDQDVESYVKTVPDVKCCYPKNEAFNWKENEYLKFSSNCTLETETRQS